MPKIRAVLQTTLAGVVATVPMSIWMLAAQRWLPADERFPLPPEQITAHAAEAAGLEQAAHNPPVRRALTLVNHFLYGGAAASLYTPFERWNAPAVLKGFLFGSAVWALSYFKLLPGLGLLSSAKTHPRRRNLLMLVAHLIWGGTLAVLSDRARQTDRLSQSS